MRGRRGRKQNIKSTMCLTLTSKVFLFALNFAVLVVAVIVLVVSTWTLVEEVDLMDMLADLATESGRGSLFKAAPIALIAVSAVLVLVSFFGCCGAIKGDKCYMTLYAVALGAFVFFYMSGAIWVSMQDLKLELEKPLNETIKRFVDNETEIKTAYDQQLIKEAWDDVMKEFHCCGVTSYEDWENHCDYFRNDTIQAKVPRQCCANILGEDNNSSLFDCIDNPSAYELEKGCLSVLLEVVDEHKSGVAVAVGLSIMIMIAAIIMAVIVIIDCC